MNDLGVARPDDEQTDYLLFAPTTTLLAELCNAFSNAIDSDAQMDDARLKALVYSFFWINCVTGKSELQNLLVSNGICDQAAAGRILARAQASLKATVAKGAPELHSFKQKAFEVFSEEMRNIDALNRRIAQAPESKKQIDLALKGFLGMLPYAEPDDASTILIPVYDEDGQCYNLKEYMVSSHLLHGTMAHDSSVRYRVYFLDADDHSFLLFKGTVPPWASGMEGSWITIRDDMVPLVSIGSMISKGFDDDFYGKIQARIQTKKLDVIGHSLGGSLAQRFRGFVERLVSAELKNKITVTAFNPMGSVNGLLSCGTCSLGVASLLSVAFITALAVGVFLKDDPLVSVGLGVSALLFAVLAATCLAAAGCKNANTSQPSITQHSVMSQGDPVSALGHILPAGQPVRIVPPASLELDIEECHTVIIPNHCKSIDGAQEQSCPALICRVVSTSLIDGVRLMLAPVLACLHACKMNSTVPLSESGEGTSYRSNSHTV